MWSLVVSILHFLLGFKHRGLSQLRASEFQWRLAVEHLMTAHSRFLGICLQAEKLRLESRCTARTCATPSVCMVTYGYESAQCAVRGPSLIICFSLTSKMSQHFSL